MFVLHNQIFNAVPPAFVPRVFLIIIQNEAERKLKTSGSFAVSLPGADRDGGDVLRKMEPDTDGTASGSTIEAVRIILSVSGL